MTTKTQANVAAAATDTGVLTNRSRLTLIGLFGSNAAPSALLLTPTGRTLTVQTGDQTPAGRVVGIDTAGIVLQSGQHTTRLTMPN